MRFTTCLVALLFITSALAAFRLKDSRDNLQQLYNGLFEQAGLPDPTTVVSCYDDNSAALTVTFIGKVLDQLANNDIFGAQATVQTFQKQLPQEVKTCLNQTEEMQKCYQVYGLAGLTLDQIQSKITNYAFGHLFEIHDNAVTADSDFKSGDFVSVGKIGGQIAQKVFSSSKTKKNLKDDKQTLQLLFNGFFEQAGLSDPTTVVACFDDSSATLTVQTLGTVLHAVAKNDIAGATNAAKTYMSQLPQPVQDCMKNNGEIQTALTAYHLTGLTPQEIQQKVEKYALAHFIQLHKDAVQADNDFQAGKYTQVGQEAGSILQKIFGSGMTVLTDDKQTLQLLFNGFFEQAGLADPTTVVACFDDSSATLTVQTLGTILQAAAKNDIAGAENAAKSYMAQLPQPVQDCMKNNGEIQNVLTAYHLTGLSNQQIEQKVEKYALAHFLALHKAAVQANNDFQAGNFEQVGHEAGNILQNIFGNGMTGLKDDRDTLQLLFNGFFEQAGLADPTTVVACFDDSSATLSVQTIGTVLHAAAKNDFTKAQDAASNYAAELPQAVKDCVKNNAEIQSALTAYHLAGLSPQEIQDKVKKYALSHLFQLHHDAVKADDDFQHAQYNAVGHEGGDIIQKIFGKNRTNFKALRDALNAKKVGDNPFQDLVQIFAGFWQNANLPQPTTPITCFELDTADVTVKMIGQLALDLANDEFLDISHTIDNFKAQVPQTLLNCFFNDSQVAVIEKAYGVANMTLSLIEGRVASFALNHYPDFHNTSVEINQDFQMGKYQKTGEYYGKLLMKAMAN